MEAQVAHDDLAVEARSGGSGRLTVEAQDDLTVEAQEDMAVEAQVAQDEIKILFY